MAGYPSESKDTSETFAFKTLAFLQASAPSEAGKEAELELLVFLQAWASEEEETELDLLAFLAFLRAWPSPEAGEPFTGRVAFLQAAGKATSSWMACLCSPVAPCMHCLLLAGSLLNLLTWLRRHTS